MTTKNIYRIANELTEQEADNIIRGWEIDNETETLENYRSLIRLGDSKQVAVATAISEKYNKKEYSKAYK